MDWSTTLLLTMATISSTMTLMLLYKQQKRYIDNEEAKARLARSHLTAYVLDDIREERLKWWSNLNDLKGIILGVEDAIQASNLEMAVVVDILQFYENLLKHIQNIDRKLKEDLKNIFKSIKKMADIVDRIQGNEAQTLKTANAQLRVLEIDDLRNTTLNSLADQKNKLRSYQEIETIIDNVFLDVIDSLHKLFTCLSSKLTDTNRTKLGEIITEETFYISDISKRLEDLAIVLNVSAKAIKTI